MIKNLSNTEKKTLKATAHSLKPAVMIGQQGLTEAVLAEIDTALDAHGLIKIRTRGADKNKRSEQGEQIEQQLNANVVDKIGGITVLYRPATSTS
jgi:RNA-binding protein